MLTVMQVYAGGLFVGQHRELGIVPLANPLETHVGLLRNLEDGIEAEMICLHTML